MYVHIGEVWTEGIPEAWPMPAPKIIQGRRVAVCVFTVHERSAMHECPGVWIRTVPTYSEA